MADLTVIYYTSNREKPEFEARIRKTLWRTIKPLRLPLISVSQKPIDFGMNICVGEKDASSQNTYRQLQIGAQHARTRFVCPAESDFIYPREYFTFRPDRDDVFYIAMPLWVLFAQRGKGRVFVNKPRGSEAAMVAGTQALVDRIEMVLKDVGQWGSVHCDGKSMPYLLETRRRFNLPGTTTARFELPTHVLSFKTDEQMHRRTPHDTQTKTRELAPFGTAADLIKRYMS
jgi:hypothetical protein